MTAPILLLASASPRRHEILKQLQIAHQIFKIPAPEGEDEPQLPGEAPDEYVRRTAREKALHAAQWLSEPLIAARFSDQKPYILCADTSVILNNEILGKPIDTEDAAHTLTRLSGKTHQVHTAVVLAYEDKFLEAISISRVTFKMLTSDEIHAYCQTGDPMGKAGAYGIQGPAAAFVQQLCGSYTGVMGLPAYDTVELLKTSGFLKQS